MTVIQDLNEIGAAMSYAIGCLSAFDNPVARKAEMKLRVARDTSDALRQKLSVVSSVGNGELSADPKCAELAPPIAHTAADNDRGRVVDGLRQPPSPCSCSRFGLCETHAVIADAEHELRAGA